MPTDSVAERLDAVRGRIAAAARRAGRDPAAVRLIAVAKTASADDLAAAWDAGQRAFGHNRVQALVHDQALLPGAEWHAIGPLQGNKVRAALGCAAWVHTVGEPRTAERLARALAETPAPGGEPLRVLLQVNLDPSDGRYGCPLESLAALADQVWSHAELALRGLMTIGPAEAPPERIRGGFARLREAAEKLAAAGALPSPPELSMGMSDDFEIAVEEGATLVRVGRTIFPPHSKR